jgi:actin related protein 2/3 complex, subunit 2
MAIKCFKDLLQYGAQQELEREYGQYIIEPEAGYDFSLLVDLESLPASPGIWITSFRKLANGE